MGIINNKIKIYFNMDTNYKIKAVLCGSYSVDYPRIEKNKVYSVQTNNWKGDGMKNPTAWLFYEYTAANDEEEITLPICYGDVKINGGDVKKIIIQAEAINGSGSGTNEEIARQGGIHGSLILNIASTIPPQVIFRIHRRNIDTGVYTDTDYDYTDRCLFYPFSETANIYVANDKVQKYKDSDSWYIYGRKIQSISSQKTSEENASLAIIGDTVWNFE